MSSSNKRVLLSIDAETVGLYGEPFAIGYTLVNNKGSEFDRAYLACPLESAQGLDSNREWVQRHVVPSLPKEYRYRNPSELCEAFYKEWMKIKNTYADLLIISDCHYPVETNLFARMVKSDEQSREFTGPYPLHEVATAIMTARMDLKDYPRNKAELPEHNPVNDARYAARLFIIAMSKTKLLRQLNRIFRGSQ